MGLLSMASSIIVSEWCSIKMRQVVKQVYSPGHQRESLKWAHSCKSVLFIGWPLPSSHHSVRRCSIDIANWQVLPLTLRSINSTDWAASMPPDRSSCKYHQQVNPLLSFVSCPLIDHLCSSECTLCPHRTVHYCVSPKVWQFFSTLARIVAIDWALIRRRRRKIVIFRISVCVCFLQLTEK